VVKIKYIQYKILLKYVNLKYILNSIEVLKKLEKGLATTILVQS